MIDLIQKHIGRGPAVKLASGIEGLVRSGKIPPEAVLPPVRELARALRVSDATITPQSPPLVREIRFDNVDARSAGLRATV